MRIMIFREQVNGLKLKERCMENTESNHTNRSPHKGRPCSSLNLKSALQPTISVAPCLRIQLSVNSQESEKQHPKIESALHQLVFTFLSIRLKFTASVIASTASSLYMLSFWGLTCKKSSVTRYIPEVNWPIILVSQVEFS